MTLSVFLTITHSPSTHADNGSFDPMLNTGFHVVMKPKRITSLVQHDDPVDLLIGLVLQNNLHNNLPHLVPNLSGALHTAGASLLDGAIHAAILHPLSPVPAHDAHVHINTTQHTLKISTPQNPNTPHQHFPKQTGNSLIRVQGRHLSLFTTQDGDQHHTLNSLMLGLLSGLTRHRSLPQDAITPHLFEPLLAARQHRWNVLAMAATNTTFGTLNTRLEAFLTQGVLLGDHFWNPQSFTLHPNAQRLLSHLDPHLFAQTAELGSRLSVWNEDETGWILAKICDHHIHPMIPGYDTLQTKGPDGVLDANTVRTLIARDLDLSRCAPGRFQKARTLTLSKHREIVVNSPRPEGRGFTAFRPHTASGV